MHGITANLGLDSPSGKWMAREGTEGRGHAFGAPLYGESHEQSPFNRKTLRPHLVRETLPKSLPPILV